MFYQEEDEHVATLHMPVLLKQGFQEAPQYWNLDWNFPTPQNICCVTITRPVVLKEG